MPNAHILPRQLRREPRPCPDLRSVEEKDERRDGERGGDEAKQGRSPVITEFVIKLVREEREGCAKEVAEEGLAC